MIFTAVPTGSRVYIDANVFIYVFAEDRLLAEPCSDFLERIETGDIGGIISAHTLSEVAHR
jgi:predicted nucleic acid-binding protein